MKNDYPEYNRAVREMFTTLDRLRYTVRRLYHGSSNSK